MLAKLKGAFQRPLSEPDLLRVIEHRIKTPPMPEDWRDALAKIRAKSDGGSLIELWRERFRADIKAIAAEPTWSLQRASLLRRITDTYTWTSLNAAVGEAANPAAWVDNFKQGFPTMASASPEHCEWQVTQQYLMALCTEACLVELGGAVYNVAEVKRMELQVIEATHRQTQMLQVRLHDDLLSRSEGDPELREALFHWHNSHCVPLLNAEWGALGALEEAVLSDTFDVRKAEEQSRAFNERLTAVLQEMPIRVDAEDGL